MAVYTEITLENLLKILNQYSIGNLIEFSGIKEGIENTNYFVRTNKGKFILTIFENRVQDKDIPFFVNIMKHLNRENFLSPKPIEDNNKNIINEFNKKKFIIVSFLEGKWKSKTNNNDCLELGQCIAEMHNKTKNFNQVRKNSLSIKGWEKLIISCKSKITKKQLNLFGPDLINEIEDSFELCKKNWPSNLPIGLIHGDIFPDNVFFNKNKVSGVIDFYFSCTDIIVYELAIAINAWCFDKNDIFYPKKASNLISGYNSKRTLSNAEFDNLSILSQGAALRFLLTRLYDWFNTPKEILITKKNPTEYLNKLRFFKNNVLLNQINLKNI